MMCFSLNRKPEQTMRNWNTGISLWLNEDMPGKSLTDLYGMKLFLCSAFENKQGNLNKNSRVKKLQDCTINR
jgi:hypothetical protein